MESLTGSSLKGVCLDKVLDKHRGLSLCSTDDVVGLSKKSEICFLGLPSFKIFHISSFSVLHKTIQPISCASDPQIHTQSEETEKTDTIRTSSGKISIEQGMLLWSAFLHSG